MRVISYKKWNEKRVGVLVEEHLIDVNRAFSYKLEKQGQLNAKKLASAQVPSDVIDFIAGGQQTLDITDDLIEWVREEKKSSGPDKLVEMGILFSINQVDVTAPIPRPNKIICLGDNYREHAIEGGDPIPEEPIYFPKYANCVIGPGEEIVIPKVTDMVDYEVELAVVIGKTGRYIEQSEAMDYVFGYTIVNDVSGRDYQRRSSQWAAGKVFDTFLPMGPFIVTRKEIGDPHDLRISCSINDEVLQDSSTKHMIFKIPKIIQDLSDILTLMPGDVIATGTPPGVGTARTPPVWLRPGDTVTLEVEKIGKMENPVVKE